MVTAHILCCMPMHAAHNLLCIQTTLQSCFVCLYTWHSSQRMATDCGRSQQHKLQMCRIITSNTMPLCACRLSRVSGDSHREPMLPCILEGLPSQDSEVTMACPLALDELLGRSSQSCKPQHMTNGASAAHVSAKVAAVWPPSLLIPPFQLPLSAGSLKGTAAVPKGSPGSPKGSAAVLKGSPDFPKGSPTSVMDSFSSVKGTVPNGKPPASPKRKPASDAAGQHCYCSDIQSYILSQHFPPSQYVAGTAAQSSFISVSFARFSLYGLPSCGLLLQLLPLSLVLSQPPLHAFSFVLCQPGFFTQSICSGRTGDLNSSDKPPMKPPD